MVRHFAVVFAAISLGGLPGGCVSVDEIRTDSYSIRGVLSELKKPKNEAERRKGVGLIVEGRRTYLHGGTWDFAYQMDRRKAELYRRLRADVLWATSEAGIKCIEITSQADPGVRSCRFFMHVSYSGDGREEAIPIPPPPKVGVWKARAMLYVGSYKVTVYDHHGRNLLFRGYTSLTQLAADPALRDVLANSKGVAADSEKG